ncbi:hypothetical protein FIBSPDRAFT_871819 [Athelia psychrophila]|uniref:Uncharacterized protein n=1 Tax=Athelia psychrophila TaxID=1759441 RepID=A0A166A2K3_9AGAM|nr:hypothetical protein FIBSPDRAFT_871819 [Fibularhizoctonia sp. CBS 109695]
MAARVGAVYLKKLFLMHMGRADALKGLLFPPSYPHAHDAAPGKGKKKGTGTGCSAEDRPRVSRAWSLAAIGLAAGAGTDLQKSGIRAAFHPVADPCACALCRETAAGRVDVLCARWALVKSQSQIIE